MQCRRTPSSPTLKGKFSKGKKDNLNILERGKSVKVILPLASLFAK
jgi:hypothetical protein